MIEYLTSLLKFALNMSVIIAIITLLDKTIKKCQNKRGMIKEMRDQL